MVKLDVEGFELDALKGMEQMLRERRIRYVVFEEQRDYPAPTHHFLRSLAIRCSGWITVSSASNVAETGVSERNPFQHFRQITWRHTKLMKQSGTWNAVYGNLSAPGDIFSEPEGSTITNRFLDMGRRRAANGVSQSITAC